MEELYSSFGWPLYKKYGHAYDAFKVALTDPDRVFEGIDIAEGHKQILMADIRHRLTPQPVKIRAGTGNRFRKKIQQKEDACGRTSVPAE
jgi:translation initiation factor 2 subunit 1